jgi:hypothetical protein
MIRTNADYKEFLDLCRWQQSGNVVFRGGGSDVDLNQSDEIKEAPLSESNCVTSKVPPPMPGIELAFDYHRPLLDLDMRCLLIESTTPGHYHLYIDKVLTWEQYKEVLEVFGRVGILQRGFVDAAMRRKRTQLRTPWTKKEQPQSEPW